MALRLAVGGSTLARQAAPIRRIGRLETAMPTLAMNHQQSNLPPIATAQANYACAK